ncbi:MarR family winged helix-turn-helix transcriptional regulator [Rhodococcus opacus]|uniref:MarR family winged helix-turn-helix transcriptional regulator n=1 Tax=Rhodococcus opacus TaxID=37919 RepID=UPI000A9CAC47|nr:MarR family winged helix-turn-helix transcriptional regulator [Rhodococcus opacus]
MTDADRSADEFEQMILSGASGAGHLLRRLSQLHTQLWRERVTDGLTGPQFTVLSILYLHGVQDQGSLCDRAGVDKSTMASILDRLASRGLVNVEKDVTDARRKVLAITPEGRHRVQQTAPLAVDANNHLLDSLTARDRKAFTHLLERLVAVVDTPQS